MAYITTASKVRSGGGKIVGLGATFAIFLGVAAALFEMIAAND